MTSNAATEIVKKIQRSIETRGIACCLEQFAPNRRDLPAEISCFVMPLRAHAHGLDVSEWLVDLHVVELCRCERQFAWASKLGFRPYLSAGVGFNITNPSDILRTQNFVFAHVSIPTAIYYTPRAVPSTPGAYFSILSGIHSYEFADFVVCPDGAHYVGHPFARGKCIEHTRDELWQRTNCVVCPSHVV